jgi:hypothetical protein
VIANYGSRMCHGEFGSDGLAIYLPGSHFEDSMTTATLACDAYRQGNTYYPVEFVDQNKWTQLIHSYMTWVSYPI